jgi:hypothetical protein
LERLRDGQVPGWIFPSLRLLVIDVPATGGAIAGKVRRIKPVLAALAEMVEVGPCRTARASNTGWPRVMCSKPATAIFK